jgi:predicted dehydrogenase
MTDGKIGVGIIGVAPGRSWAAIAHIPALRALPEYEIVALSTTKADSAAAAASAFDIPLWFDNHAELVAHPKVDLVAVTVKVPHHYELVTAALDAGKKVYCEWPLGNGLEEAEALAAHAKRASIPTAVGLQARSAPVVNYVKDLVKDGFVGKVLSVTLVGSGLSWGPVIELPNAYNAEKKNGATVLTIPFGHTVDALQYILGPLTEVAATLAVRRTSFTVAETGETRPMTAEDQVAVTGLLEGGAVAAIHYRGGMSRSTNMLWEINGTEGDLRIDAFGGHAQLLDLTLFGVNGAGQAMQPMPVPEKYHWVSPSATGVALNVAQAYARFAADLRDGTKSCPDFDDAVGMHKVLAAIEQSAATGQRIRL